jgi:hypothetical protein
VCILGGPLRDVQDCSADVTTVDLPYAKAAVECWLAGLPDGRMNWEDLRGAIEVPHA